MRIIVRAVPERAAFVEYLRERVPGAEFCFDENRNAMDTFLKALDMAGRDPVVHMEDDAVLSPDFQARLTEVISKRPERVVQFFSRRKADIETGSRWDRNFMAAVCFYMPAGYSEEVRKYYEVWPDKQKHPTGLDLMVHDWLRSRKEPHWIHVPSLVDHRVCKSAIDSRRSSKRQSLTFGYDHDKT